MFSFTKKGKLEIGNLHEKKKKNPYSGVLCNNEKEQTADYTLWMSSKVLMLQEKSQTQETTYRMVLFL